MKIRLYNTLTNRLEDFAPITPGLVRMYHCGPTVYDYAHIGNFRSFILADLLRRFFEFVGYDVIQVMNITDVGHMTEDHLADGGGQDKMELAGQRLKAAKKQGLADVDNPNDPYQVAQFFTRAFLHDARLMGMKLADEYPQHMPHATANVPGMIRMIGRLIDAGHAYVGGDGAVYYDVTTFKDYGRLSGNTVEALQSGAGGRIEEDDQAAKRHPADFLLWKPDDKHLMKWDSPWGVGYPGWHIECSVMAMDTHGVATLDIHTGGEDNIFPHHECEIAQSTGATGQPFANYWIHARHLMVEGQKMSKSKGNFYTVRDLIEKGVEPAVLRFELLRAPYRTNANFTFKGLDDAQRQVRRFREFAGAKPTDLTLGPIDAATPVQREIAGALADDLNMSAALGALNKWLNATPAPTAADRATMWRIDSVLGVLNSATSVQRDGDQAIDQRVRELDAARAAKNFALSDAIRDELIAAGIEVQIRKEGSTWRRKMSLES